VLPPNNKISKNAKETMQECASEFIGFVTGEAADICKKEKRKTINGDDICQAFGVLVLDHYAEAMKRYLKRYRECEDNMIALKVSTSADQLDRPRTELSLFGGNLHDEDDQTFSNLPTITKFL
jgi:nuclear transcription Y subunit beta